MEGRRSRKAPQSLLQDVLVRETLPYQLQDVFRQKEGMRRSVRAEGAARKRVGLFPEGQPRFLPGLRVGHRVLRQRAGACHGPHQHRALRVSDECGCPQDSPLRIQAEPGGGHGLHAGAHAGEI